MVVDFETLTDYTQRVDALRAVADREVMIATRASFPLAQYLHEQVGHAE